MLNKNKVFYTLLHSCFFVIAFTWGQEPNQNLLFTNNEITVIDRTNTSDGDINAVAFGKREFFKALRKTGVQISNIKNWSHLTNRKLLVLGSSQDSLVKHLLGNKLNRLKGKAEGVFYQQANLNSNTAIVIGGTDAKGTMYALYEMAEKVYDKGISALANLENNMEFPDNKVRGIDRFIKDENDDQWFFSQEFWEYYISQLARNRFNRLTLITGYNDGKSEDFMIPVYPYFFQVPGFKKTTIKKDLNKTPEAYTNQLKRIGKMCSDYGVEFVFGIWGHGRSNSLIDGLPEDAQEYTRYCSTGIYELLKRVPEIDGIQLRVNYESGIGGFGNTADQFWKEIISAIAKAKEDEGRDLFLDIRAKGLTSKIRDWASKTSIDFSVTSKYTWEGMGLPYHPLQMRKGELDLIDNEDKRQRYGYADFLSESRDFDFIYRLWGIGTSRIFTWADPDYARRFSYSTRFGDAKGFQVTPPMARKQNTWELMKDKSMAYYKWEDQRYWAWYLLFGRLGYSTKTKPEVWQRAFKAHYGSAYQNILNAYSVASNILPLITSSHLTNHPANYNWAEMDSGGALFNANNSNPIHKQKNRTYQSAEPGDPGMFYSINDYVNDVIKGRVQPKITPIQLSDYHKKLSDEILGHINQVNEADIPKLFQKEYKTNMSDLNILSALSSYHAYKIIATVNYVYYKETKNDEYLHLSINHLEKAKSSWEIVVDKATETYYPYPMFLHDNGTWKDRLFEIEKDIDSLHQIKDHLQLTPMTLKDHEFGKTNFSFNTNFSTNVPSSVTLGDTLQVVLKSAKFTEENQVPHVHYRLADMTLGKFSVQEMIWDGHAYLAKIPTSDLNPDYDLLVYFTSVKDNTEVVVFPGLYNETHNSPYYTIELEK
ncbi:hypothetical protein [Seonamhaeicola sp. ML3]|uniref:hypothetical protein n=1 Tax=Seonamhaeicola sp. ML3 TaxID=2937786 RepID=UPI00200CB3CB|nr:hypothetical protein [Seonamhaeicola sp. ML3]